VVDGLSGAQYAFAGAVDQLRAARTLPDDDQALVLATTDPANPYGAILPWPPVADPTGGLPRRVAGSAVVLVGGEPVLFLERAGRRALTFGAARDEAKLAVAAKALGQVAARRRGKFIRLETIDGGPARSSSCADALRRSGFTEDPKGLVLEVR
jgi:ATP-dependent Lhr-like helicase